MQNIDFHCFEWLCIVFVWFAWFWLICIVFYDLHGFHTCSWYFNYFLIFLLRNHANPMCNSHHRFFLINHNSHVEISYLGANLAWFDLRGPAGTCGDLRGPVETCWDRSSFWAKSHLDLHFCANSNFHTCFLCFCSKSMKSPFPQQKKTDFRLNVMNTTLFHLARYFLWTITVQHFKTVNCNDKHFCFFNPQNKLKNDNILCFFEVF